MAEKTVVSPALRPVVDRALAALEALAPRYVGACSARAEVAHVVERTHSTCTVLRLSAAGVARRFYLKTLESTEASRALKRAQLVEEYRLLEDLSPRFAPYPGLGVITPVACWPEDLSLLTEEFPGESLEAAIGRANRFRGEHPAEQIETLCRLAGRWLSLFQMFTKPTASQPDEMGPLLAYCERRLQILGDAPGSGADTGLVRAVRAHLGRLAAEVSPEELTSVGRQNDFRPDNIVTDGTRIAVLDFTGFTSGPALYDFVKFWMKLEDYGSGPLFGTGRVTRWQAAFAEGYGSMVDLTAPLARFLLLANRLDKMSEFAAGDGPSPGPLRRLSLRRWYGAQLRSVRAAVAGDHGPGRGA